MKHLYHLLVYWSVGIQIYGTKYVLYRNKDVALKPRRSVAARREVAKPRRSSRGKQRIEEVIEEEFLDTRIDDALPYHYDVCFTSDSSLNVISATYAKYGV
jgi:hypothetical protein